MCWVEGVEMCVARLAGPTWDRSWDRRVPEDPTTDETTSKLNFSMSKIAARTAMPTAGGDSDGVASRGQKLSLRGLLHDLWDPADLFRWRRTVGDALAIEGLRQALRQRLATPAEIAREAEAAGLWAKMEPYLMALTSDP